MMKAKKIETHDVEHSIELYQKTRNEYKNLSQKFRQYKDFFQTAKKHYRIKRFKQSVWWVVLKIIIAIITVIAGICLKELLGLPS